MRWISGGSAVVQAKMFGHPSIIQFYHSIILFKGYSGMHTE